VPASRAPQSTPISDALADLTRRGTLTADPRQADAAAVLDRIARDLEVPAPLFGRRKPVRGAYPGGAVGRG
jgi:predicted ATPase